MYMTNDSLLLWEEINNKMLVRLSDSISMFPLFFDTRQHHSTVFGSVLLLTFGYDNSGHRYLAHTGLFAQVVHGNWAAGVK
jgi:hypothetical protein